MSTQAIALLCLLAISTHLATGQAPTYSDPLPGSVITPEDNRTRINAPLPPSNLRGAYIINSWTVTNSFVRYFKVEYGTLTVTGEFKHGLWYWRVPGATIPAWWCQLGGSWLGSDGHTDTFSTHPSNTQSSSPSGENPQINMRVLWDRLYSSPNANKLGPLGIAAGLRRMATTVIRVVLHGGGYDPMSARLWKNRGNSTYPLMTPVSKSEGEFEVYIVSAPYNYNTMLSTPRCPPGKVLNDLSDTSCGLEHSFVVVVTSEGITRDTVGVLNYGLAYDRSTRCPMCNGGPCKCDGLLIDLMLSGVLTDEPELAKYVPDDKKPSKDAGVVYKTYSKFGMRDEPVHGY